MPHTSTFKLLLAVRLCQHMPLYVSACPLSSRPLSPSLPLSPPPTIYPPLPPAIAFLPPSLFFFFVCVSEHAE